MLFDSLFFVSIRLTKCPYKKQDNFDSPEERKSIVECLKTKPMEELMNTHPNFYDWRHLEQCQVWKKNTL